MSYHIKREGKELGTFTEDGVIAALEKGDILPTDELWTEGMDGWQPVHDVIEEDENEQGHHVEHLKHPPVAEDDEPPPPPPPSPVETQRGTGETMLVPRSARPPVMLEEALLEPDEEPVEHFVDEPVEVCDQEFEEPAEESEEPAPEAVEDEPSTMPEPEAPAPPPAPATVYRPASPAIQPGQYGTAGTAIASMVMGILSLITGFLTGMPAIVCGHLARGHIRRTGGAYSGDGLAVAGLVLGYVTSTLSLAWVVLLFAGFPVPLSQTLHTMQKELHVRGEGRDLALALKRYAKAHENKFPAKLDQLVSGKVLEEAKLKQLQKTDLGPLWKGPTGWDYLGDSLPDDDANDRPLLISRAADADGHHLVVNEDASTEKAEVQSK